MGQLCEPVSHPDKVKRRGGQKMLQMRLDLSSIPRPSQPEDPHRLRYGPFDPSPCGVLGRIGLWILSGTSPTCIWQWQDVDMRIEEGGADAVSTL